MPGRFRHLVPALLLALLTGCAHGGGKGDLNDDIKPTDSPVSVQVVNNHALPMEIYAIGSGITYRVGTVHPGMSGRFGLPQNMVGNGSVVFEARPSGGGQPFRSGDILLAPGSIIDFQIGAQLFNSVVTRRP
jgi:hypothetical protein